LKNSYTGKTRNGNKTHWTELHYETFGNQRLLFYFVQVIILYGVIKCQNAQSFLVDKLDFLFL